MKPKTIILAVIGAALLGVLVSVLMRPASGGIVNVDAAGVEKAIADGAQVVDVRTAGEYQMGHIPGAINVPVDQLEASAASWDRNATYVVYCATGARSATAVETMKSMGFGSIKHFNAGIQAWGGKLDTGAPSASTSKIQTNGKPVFIEFFTDSWPTCQQMKPVVDGLAKEYEGKVEFRRYNAEKDAEAVQLANEMGITAVPTFIFVNSDGVQAGTKLGGGTAEEFRALIDKLQ